MRFSLVYLFIVFLSLFAFDIPVSADEYSISDVVRLCLDQSCPTVSVTVRGQFRRMDNEMQITDGQETIYLKFVQGTDFLEILKVYEDNKVLLGGWSEVELRGRSLQTKYLPTNGRGGSSIVAMDVRPEDVHFIKTIRCYDPVNDQGTAVVGYEKDCFKEFRLTPSRALGLLKASRVYPAGAPSVTRFSYGYLEAVDIEYWEFDVLSGEEPDDWSMSCKVYAEGTPGVFCDKRDASGKEERMVEYFNVE